MKVESTSVKKDKEKKARDKKGKPGKFNIKYLGGALFKRMAKGGACELGSNAEEVNKLNVFPVPDGDTGDNMRMTIESGIAALEKVNSSDLAEVMQTLSRGMLLGARGNSGVILSQLFAGMAISGQCLHAKLLELTHPKTKEKMNFESELPQEFCELLEKLRKQSI